MIKKDSDLYIAISDAIYDMFNGEIPIDDPTETTKIFVEQVNKHLGDGEEDD